MARLVSDRATIRCMTRRKYRWRTRIRRHLPWVLVDRDWMAKGSGDCGSHEWYNADGVVERCYHCEVGERAYSPQHFTSPRGLSGNPTGASDFTSDPSSRAYGLRGQ